MRTNVMLSTGFKVHVSPDFIKISSIIASFVFDSFGLKLSLIVILTNFSHSSNSSKLLAHENLQCYSIKVLLKCNEVVCHSMVI